MNPVKAIWILAVLALSAGAAWALETDRDQPINIEADTVDIDERADTSIYRGDVLVTQGSMRLRADVVTLYGLRDPSKIVAEGRPVKFRQLPKPDSDEVRGEAQRLEYLVPDDKLFLFDNATIWQGENTFGSDRIEYDVNRELVRAGDRNDSGKRVRVVIQPRKDEE